LSSSSHAATIFHLALDHQRLILLRGRHPTRSRLAGSKTAVWSRS
jgi:hypothetical protein